VINFIKKVIKKVVISLGQFISLSTKWTLFWIDLYNYKNIAAKNNQRFSLKLNDLYPCIDEKISTTEIEPHYTYHVAWASRVVAKLQPDYHIDISSYIYFSTIVSAFVPVKFYDYRPAKLILSNLTSESADLLNLSLKDNSIQSISCMHVIEHIGLGRYGDPLDPEGDLKAIKELKRVLAVNGSLLFVVPVGKPKIMFNAHRIYSYEQIMSYFSDLNLEEFALIPDNGQETGLLYNSSKELVDNQNWGCGCFWFKKP